MIRLRPFFEILWPFAAVPATLLVYTHYKAGFVPEQAIQDLWQDD